MSFSFLSRAAAIVGLAAMIGSSAFAQSAADHIVYQGKDGPGKGKHIVFLSGDEEYRSEEGLPMLAKILSQRHGFKCTVLFSVDKEGKINPEKGESLSHPEALDSANAIVMLLRFRHWDADTMKRFDALVKKGTPIIALRTSTHAFAGVQGDFSSYDKFGENVLGEEWVSHWGGHKSEATKGVIEPENKDHPVLRGITDIFGDTDVYEAYPPADAKILVRGAVLKGMKPDAPLADYKKKRASDGQEQGVNSPMMPVAWAREYKHDNGKTSHILCTTMGAATDLQNEGLRRLVVNGVYWGLGMDVPAKANVEYVDPFYPTDYGFGSYRKGIVPADHELGKSLPAPAKK